MFLIYIIILFLLLVIWYSSIGDMDYPFRFLGFVIIWPITFIILLYYAIKERKKLNEI